MMKYIPAQIYLYDFKSFFIRASIIAAIAVTVYSVLFGFD